MNRLLLAALVGSVMITGCARADAETRTYVGQVTEVDAGTVCVGGPEASGECFVKDQVTERLRLNDCVSVTYAPEPPQQGPYRAKEVAAADVASHPSECPN
jgi:nitrous oxide reductase accessory protein NosL